MSVQIDMNTGILVPCKLLPSPHFNERPEAVDVDMVVIHGISLPAGQFGTGAIESFFQGCLDLHQWPMLESIAAMRVSSHLFINRQGEVIQFVSFLKRAWHAGMSSYQGRFNCNDFSIGIELEGTDATPYELAQYASLAKIIILLQKYFPKITSDRIVGHSDIAPQRKTDPGASFNWFYLHELLSSKVL